MSLTSDYSLSDIAAVTGSNGGRNGGDMWGQEWIWIIVLFLFAGGWGNNGFGGNGNNGAGGSGFQGYATRADINEGFAMNNLDSGIRSLQNGLCDSTYALNNSITGGFAGVNNALCQGFNSTNVAMMQGFNGVDRSLCGVQSQIADCCCQTQNAIQGVRYDMATQACETRNTIQNTTRDIIDNANSNSRAILDFLVQDKISTLTAENQSLKFQASQTAQNGFIDAVGNSIVAQLRQPVPQPAYVVPNPNAAYSCCNPCVASC